MHACMHAPAVQMLLAKGPLDPSAWEADYLIMIHTAHADAALDVAFWLYRTMLEAAERMQVTHGSADDGSAEAQMQTR